MDVLADGEIVKTAILTADAWDWSFTGLPKYRDGGTAIVYTAMERPVSGYTSETVCEGDGPITCETTNTYTPGKTQVNVIKVWDDQDDQDGFRPASAVASLLANDEETGDTLTLNEANNWSGSFTDLDEVDAQGVSITYTVAEPTLPTGYTAAILEFPDGVFTITNSYEPETIDISGTKTWEGDNNDELGTRPERVYVDVLADGEIVKTAILEVDSWDWSFTGLPKYRDGGTAIVYTAMERPVSGYTSETVCEGEGPITCETTNTYTPGKTQVNVIKTWDDMSDMDQIRPSSVTVNLLANGTATGDTLSLSEENKWSGSFTDLDEVDAGGQTIAYSIQEITIPGYEAKITGSHQTGFIIVNSHYPETEWIYIRGTKAWEGDNDDALNTRPDRVYIDLLADGTIIASTSTTADDGWNWEFPDVERCKVVVTNNVPRKLCSTFTVQERPVSGYTSVVSGEAETSFTVTNTYTPGKTQVNVSKAWDDDNNRDGIRQDAVTVKLLAGGTDTGRTLELNESNNWVGSFTDLDESANGVLIAYTVKEDPVPTDYTAAVTGSQEMGYTITNTHMPETINISGTKTWVGDNDDADGTRPDAIMIDLLADGRVVTSVPTDASKDWEWSITGMNNYSGGKEIVYTVMERPVSGYTSEAKDNGDGTWEIINTYTPGKIQINVNKAWNDDSDHDGIRPTVVEVKLLADGKDTGKTLSLSLSNNWSGSFTDLDQYTEEGTEISYSVEEPTLPTGYTAKVNGSQKDGFTIVNTYDPEKINICGTKVWEDNDDAMKARPDEIVIELMADGVVVAAKPAAKSDEYAWCFNGMDKFKAVQSEGSRSSVEISYTVRERPVSNYTSEIDQTTRVITNTYTPGKTQVDVTKVWDDDNDRDGKRPDAVTVKLLANDEETGDTLDLNEANSWTGSFTGLDVSVDGAVVEYSVAEEAPEGYTAAVTGSLEKGFTVTNTHAPETIDINGTKVWEDENDQDGIRPDHLIINLQADGKIIASTDASEADNWEWSVTGLNKYRDGGTEIVYTVVETPISGYKTTIDQTVYEITNTYTPSTIQVNVTKVWDDKDDQDGKRPESVKVKLLADGTATGDELELNEGSKWSGSFSGLDEFKDGGTAIVYTVEESEVPAGYTMTASGSMKDGFTITNSYTPETIEISGTKVWEGDEDLPESERQRPDHIIVELLADGKLTTITDSTEASGWTWSFTGLPKFKNGKEIVYTVREYPVPGYTGEVDPETNQITNTFTPEKVQVNVNKVWSDKDNQDGLRPDSVTVKLLADGTDTGKTLTLEGETWSGSFTDLDKYKDGKAIVYTVEEAEVPEGYTAAVSGTQNGSFTVTNTHVPETIDITGTKVWDDQDNKDGIRPDRVYVELLADGRITAATMTNADMNWEWSFTGLDKNKAGEPINYQVFERTINDYQTIRTQVSENVYEIKNTHTPETTQVNVNKLWADKDNKDGLRPASVIVKLLADGTDTGKRLVLDADGGWAGTFTELDKGPEYTVEEEEVPEGYTASVTGNQRSGFTVTNTHTPAGETIDIPVTVEWDDQEDKDKIRPENTTVKLLANGEEAGEATLCGEECSHTFKDLPKNDEQGNPITYTIVEVETDVITGEDGEGTYSYEITGTPEDGFTVTNTHTPAEPPIETIDIPVTVEWDDENDADKIRPENTTVKLLANGEEAGEATLCGEECSHTFKDLPKNDEQGNPITYTIVEVETNVITGEDGEGTYSYEITGTPEDGFTVTNTHTPAEPPIETIDVPITVVWDDEEDKDGIRPENTTIRILANCDDPTGKSVTKAPAECEEMGTATLCGENCQHTFEGLPAKDDEGNPITYTVVQVTTDVITGEDTETTYSFVIEGDQEEGFTITNTHTPLPPTIDIPITVVWEDEEDKDGIRPTDTTIVLRANGEIVESATLCGENCQHTFEGLPTHDEEGNPITYTVTQELTSVITGEDTETTYSFTIDGTAQDGFTITNIHTPVPLKLTVRKTWGGNGPKSTVTAVLLANGEEVETAELSESNNWFFEFADMPKYDENGDRITYTVEEQVIPEGYQCSVMGSDTKGFVINNSYIPVIPPFFDLDGELPETGITGAGFSRMDKPAAVEYIPLSLQLQIPTLNVMTGIVEVEAVDGRYPVEWLGTDAALLKGTALPGEGISVVAAHNTLNAEEIGPFVMIFSLEKGDRYFVSAEDGSMLIYEVYANEKIASDDMESLQKMASAWPNTLTLLTCEDERVEGGYASRRIVSARKVN